MRVSSFFENLQCRFEDDKKSASSKDTMIYKDDKGRISEIRIFNPDYDEFLVVKRDGDVFAVNIDEAK